MTDDSYLAPEARARQRIDRMLERAGWVVQDRGEINLYAGPGVAVREFRMSDGGYVDYLLFVSQVAVGVLEAKKPGWTLTSAEPQTDKYRAGLPDNVQASDAGLRFAYRSTGAETYFTDHSDPHPRSRKVFSFHQPETMAAWLREAADVHEGRPTLRTRLRTMPPISDTARLWPAQRGALENLEESLATDHPRALVQMATGSGKTYLAATLAYRLVKYGGAKRVLFLVDRSNLGTQAKDEFDNLEAHDEGRKFSELYPIVHLTSERVPPESKVVVSTIQRIYSILSGQPLDPEDEDISLAELDDDGNPVDVTYNAELSPESFDVIIIDEAHRSIYGKWRPVLDYFDAYLIGLTATPTKITFGFFNQNIVYEYSHEQAVADKVNVDFDVYTIRTKIGQDGSHIEAGTPTLVRDRVTRSEALRNLDDDFEYHAKQLDREVVARDQIRTVVKHFREKLFKPADEDGIFPHRTVVPKTLIFAKDDSHAEDIVHIVREVFGKGDDFCQKITSKTSGAKPEDLLKAFRNSYNPRIAVTVDLIATGTDVKAIECVFFMRAVKSRAYFEQMKGRGVRVINDDDFQAVTNDPVAPSKTRFVIIDAVGVTDEEKQDTVPLNRKKSVPLKRLLEDVASGSRDIDTLSTIASRLARLQGRMTHEDAEEINRTAGDDTTLPDIVRGLMDVVDPDLRHARVEQLALSLAVDDGRDEPSSDDLEAAKKQVLNNAAKPLAANPALRTRLLEIGRSFEQLIDEYSKDQVTESGFSHDATDRARNTLESWKAYIEEHKEDIGALQVLFGSDQARVPTLEQLKELQRAISRPPLNLSPEAVWEAYERIEEGRVRKNQSEKAATADLLSLLRFELGLTDELAPFAETVEWRWQEWLREQQTAEPFTPEQLSWLEAMKDVVAQNVTLTVEDFEFGDLQDRGGLIRAHQTFDGRLDQTIDELNTALTQ